MDPLNVAIIGGGPAGLTLAALLLSPGDSSHINVTVFEKDESASTRTTKGGTLDLHADTGLAAIDAAGIRPAFDACARYDVDSGRIIFSNRNGLVVHVVDMSGVDVLSGEEGEQRNKELRNTRPEIDREDLKEILLEAIPEKTIQWGKHISSISHDGATLRFSDGTIQAVKDKYDIVVGAEGTWSKVRAHITDSKPVYSGISGIELRIFRPKETHPSISKQVGGGLRFNLGANRAIAGQQLGNGSIMLYAFKRGSANGPEELIESCGGDTEKVKEKLISEYTEAGFSSELCGWIEAADPEILRGWPLYEFELPNGHVFPHKEGWTVVGDAAHVMVPFAGEGVNTGMRDALELANRLKATAKVNTSKERRKQALDVAVQEYEEEMFVRSRAMMTESYQNKLGFFEDDAPESLVKKFEEMFK